MLSLGNVVRRDSLCASFPNDHSQKSELRKRIFAADEIYLDAKKI
jgi:hypothetical protein